LAASGTVSKPSSIHRIETQRPPEHCPGIGCAVPENAVERFDITLFQSPSAIVFVPMCWRQGRSAFVSPYAWWPTTSRIGFDRPLAR
jgi:hypothetical protein